MKELKEADRKNAREIKTMQDEIKDLRVSILQKENRIRDLKSLICTLHIKLHGRSASRDKSVTLSVRKFMTESNKAIQEMYVGNKGQRGNCREVLDRVREGVELERIMFGFDRRKELLTFKCVYGSEMGALHCPEENARGVPSTPYKCEPVITNTDIPVRKLLSLKLYFKSRIVGA